MPSGVGSKLAPKRLGALGGKIWSEVDLVLKPSTIKILPQEFKEKYKIKSSSSSSEFVGSGSDRAHKEQGTINSLFPGPRG